MSQDGAIALQPGQQEQHSVSKTTTKKRRAKALKSDYGLPLNDVISSKLVKFSGPQFLPLSHQSVRVDQ